MKKTFLLPIVLLLCSYCTRNEVPTEKQVHARQAIARITADDSLYVNGDTVDLADLNDYKFGDFFYARASFFVVPNPDMEILQAHVNELVIFCLDGLPTKRKYVLDRDASDAFMNRYRCKIIPRDRKNQQILEAEGGFRNEMVVSQSTVS